MVVEQKRTQPHCLIETLPEDPPGRASSHGLSRDSRDGASAGRRSQFTVNGRAIPNATWGWPPFAGDGMKQTSA